MVLDLKCKTTEGIVASGPLQQPSMPADFLSKALSLAIKNEDSPVKVKKEEEGADGDPKPLKKQCTAFEKHLKKQPGDTSFMLETRLEALVLGRLFGW